MENRPFENRDGIEEKNEPRPVRVISRTGRKLRNIVLATGLAAAGLAGTLGIINTAKKNAERDSGKGKIEEKKFPETKPSPKSGPSPAPERPKQPEVTETRVAVNDGTVIYYNGQLFAKEFLNGRMEFYDKDRRITRVVESGVEKIIKSGAVAEQTSLSDKVKTVFEKEATRVENPNGETTVTSKDGIQVVYDKDGDVIRVIDVNGDEITFSKEEQAQRIKEIIEKNIEIGKAEAARIERLRKNEQK